MPAGPGPRHELFVYVENLDASIADVEHAGGRVLRAPAQMTWGETLAYLQVPEGNLVTLAQATYRPEVRKGFSAVRTLLPRRMRGHPIPRRPRCPPLGDPV